MRIVFSNYDDLRNPYYGGGGAGAIHEIARRLAARHQITVVTGAYPGARDEVVDGVLYQRIGLKAAGAHLGQLLFHFTLPYEVRRRTFDLWVESLTPPFSTACLQLFSRQPVTLLTQNLPGWAMARKYRIPFHWVERLGLKTYRFGIALSETIRAELLASNPAMQVAVIPNGVDPALIHNSVQNSGDHILFLGRIDVQQKGLDLLLRAFRQAIDRGVPPLLIAGSGIASDEARLNRQIAELGLTQRVRCLGKISGKEKDAAFQRALFLVMPSRFEGFPLTLLEAFCWRLPVVLFSIPELAWLPESCCMKIEPFDVPAFADAMTRLARDSSLREAMGCAAKQWVRAFSWDVLAERYEIFFAKILNSRQI